MIALPEPEEGRFFTKADLRREFGLTDAQIALLGEPDPTQPLTDPGGRAGGPVYSSGRIRAWLADNQELLEEAQAKRRIVEARRARAAEEAEIRRDEARETVATAVRQWRLRDLPAAGGAVENVRHSLQEQYGEFTREANERAIFTYILEKFTDYDRIVRMLARLEAGFELSAAVRIYICCQVIRECGLNLDPLEVAFGGSAASLLPAAYRSEDPEIVAARRIGLAA